MRSFKASHRQHDKVLASLPQAWSLGGAHATAAAAARRRGARMKRREVLLALGGLLLPLAARAQSHASLPRIVMYSAGEPLDSMHENSYNRYIRALFAEMRRLGLIEGKSITIERYGRETLDVTS